MKKILFLQSQLALTLIPKFLGMGQKCLKAIKVQKSYDKKNLPKDDRSQFLQVN